MNGASFGKFFGMVAPFSKFCGKVWLGKAFSERFPFKTERVYILQIFEIDFHLRDWHVCFYMTIKIVVSRTIFLKREIRLKMHRFHVKLPYQKTMLRQVE